MTAAFNPSTLLSDSAYKLTQFKPAQIQALEGQLSGMSQRRQHM